MKIIPILILCITAACKNSVEVKVTPTADSLTKPEIKPALGHPFGTLLTLTVQVVDGDSLDSKGLTGSFAFLVRNINNKSVTDSIILKFKDETGKFPNDIIGLSTLIYGDNSGYSSAAADSTMKQQYAGKSFTVVAYESGEFTGIPDGYFDYQEVRQDVGFGFSHYLVVIADKSGEIKNNNIK